MVDPAYLNDRIPLASATPTDATLANHKTLVVRSAVIEQFAIAYPTAIPITAEAEYAE